MVPSWERVMPLAWTLWKRRGWKFKFWGLVYFQDVLDGRPADRTVAHSVTAPLLLCAFVAHAQMSARVQCGVDRVVTTHHTFARLEAFGFRGRRRRSSRYPQGATSHLYFVSVVDGEETPQLQRVVHVHPLQEERGVLPYLQFSRFVDDHAELVALVEIPSGVVYHHPVLGPVHQRVGIGREGFSAQERRLAGRHP
ncbi:unnamed protein product [Tenebrio molitor]|nr:unnamed protein product [Tenebrio molitor]